jgi:alpha-L-fucosidase
LHPPRADFGNSRGIPLPSAQRASGNRVNITQMIRRRGDRGDGNLLLNVGPLSTGEIDPKQVEVLHQMGEWLRKYGHTLYGTRSGPIPNGEWGGCTTKGGKVWVHILKWPGETLRLSPLPSKIPSTRVLTADEARVEQSSDRLEISMSSTQHDPLDTITELYNQGNTIPN